MDRSTIEGWKLKKGAATGGGPTAPTGATRAAKYPIQKPRSPVARSARWDSGAK